MAHSLACSRSAVMMGVEWKSDSNQPTSMLAEMVRRDWEMAAAHGETTFGSRVYNPRTMDAVTFLNREGVAPSAS